MKKKTKTTLECENDNNFNFNNLVENVDIDRNDNTLCSNLRMKNVKQNPVMINGIECDHIDKFEYKSKFLVKIGENRYWAKDIFVIRIGIKNGRIQYLPSIMRHILSKAIYFLINSKPTLSREQIIDSLIKNLIKKNMSIDWVKEMEEGILTYLHNKFQEPNFEGILRYYLKDLIEISYRLIDFGNKPEPFRVLPFCEELVKDGYNLGIKARHLRRIIKDLIDYLNKNINDFDIQLTELKRVVDDGTHRICSKCGDRKPYNEFSKGVKGFRSICKECSSKYNTIVRGISKLRVITEIYEGKFRNGKCGKCGIDIAKLPNLTMHHLDLRLKKNTLSKLLQKYSTDYKKIIEILQPEKVVLMCINCQRLEHGYLFIRFRDIILDPNLYNYTVYEIEANINSFKKRNGIKGEVTKIKEWIKKRVVIEYLFNGRCAGCGEITVFNNLQSLEFHHIGSIVEEKLRWKRIRHLNIKKIIIMLLEEECTCLCANCHKLIGSHRFAKHSVEILGEIRGQEARDEYNKLVYNIQKFNIFKNSRLHPIIIDFTLDKVWKRVLLCAYNIAEKKGKNEFTNEELNNCLKLSETWHYTQELTDMELINTFSYGHHVKRVYFLTEKGYKVIAKLFLF